MSVGLAGSAPSPHFASNHMGKNSSSCSWANACACRRCGPERLAASSEGLCCHVISRVLFHVDVRLTKTQIAVNVWLQLTLPSSCGKHISLVSIPSASGHFRTAMDVIDRPVDLTLGVIILLQP